jgi:hypothetical protein
LVVLGSEFVPEDDMQVYVAAVGEVGRIQKRGSATPTPGDVVGHDAPGKGSFKLADDFPKTVSMRLSPVEVINVGVSWLIEFLASALPWQNWRIWQAVQRPNSPAPST